MLEIVWRKVINNTSEEEKNKKLFSVANTGNDARSELPWAREKAIKTHREVRRENLALAVS